MRNAPLQANEVTAFHDRRLQDPAWPDAPFELPQPLWHWIQTNHRNNCRLWAEEDLARRKTVADADIAANKRAIDGYNQARNDATERVDEILLMALGLVDEASARSDAPVSTVRPAARLNSETAGSMIDRMSILALKIHAMRQQTVRQDVDAEHRAVERRQTRAPRGAACRSRGLPGYAAGRRGGGPRVLQGLPPVQDVQRPSFQPGPGGRGRAARLSGGPRETASALPPPMQVLIVKTSSMGDVVHALPALSDMLAARPGLQVDWLVETPFADIVRLHPGVRRVWPLGWRKWRRKLLDAQVRQAIATLTQDLRAVRYDLVLDLQGLLKSAWWGRRARAPMAGYDRHSAREPLAAMFYARRAGVPRELQAVVRNRRLAAAHLGYAMPASAPDFGLRAPAGSWGVEGRTAALIPCASRAEKLWPEDRWVAIGRQLHAEGMRPVVVWGDDAEHHRAELIAAACGGVVPPFLSVGDMAAVLARAERVVGLDTGFTHLAAALGRPTVGIYCDHEPGLAGITGSGPVTSLGGKGRMPALAEVEQALQALKERRAARSFLDPHGRAGRSTDLGGQRSSSR